jgi:hypothetical protein
MIGRRPGGGSFPVARPAVALAEPLSPSRVFQPPPDGMRAPGPPGLLLLGDAAPLVSYPLPR